MSLITGRILLLIVFTTTFIHAQNHLPIAGKWSQTDSKDFIGIWKLDNQQALLDGTGKGTINNITAQLGTADGVPLTIDFIGDSRDEIAIYYPSSGLIQFYADIYSGVITSEMETGITNAIPVSGRWGYGNSLKDGYALYQSASPSPKIHFFQTHLSSSPFQQNSVGKQNDILLAGDWDGDGLDGLAIFRPDTHQGYQIDFYQSYTSKKITKKVDLGNRGGIPLAGDWSGNGTDHIALYTTTGSDAGQFSLFSSDTGQLADSIQWTDHQLYNVSAGRQLIYTAGVPHTDINGRMMPDYDPKRSFFPKGIDKINLDSISQIRDAGFNLGILSGLDYPIPATAKEVLDGFNNDFRMILPFQELGGHPFVANTNGSRDMIGIYDLDHAFVALDTDGDHVFDFQKQFGMAALQIVHGDWNGDGVDGYAIVQANNQVRIGDTMEEAPGYAVNMPFNGTLLAMDNDKDPEDEYAIFHDDVLTYYSSIYTTIGITVQIPSEGDVPIIGDWNGDGKDGFALYKPSTRTVRFFEEVNNVRPLRFKLVNTVAISGGEGDLIMAGDWDGDGSDGIGFYNTTVAKDKHAFTTYNNINDISIDVDSASTHNPMVDPNLKKYMFGMYTFDEPSGAANATTYGYLEQLYKAYDHSNIDEAAPLFYHTDTQIIPGGDKRSDYWEKMNHFGDVVSHDDYPIGSVVHSLARIGETVGCSLRDDRPNWLTIQTFASPSNRLVAPTPAQVKSMIYTAVIHGATGIFSFMYHDPIRFPEYTGLSPTSSPEVWTRMKELNAELDELTRFIFTKSPERISTTGEEDTDFRIYTRQQAPGSPDYEFVNGSPIRTLLKRDPNNGDYLLMAVNITDEPFDAIVSLPINMQPTDGRIIKKMFEGNDLQLTAGAINDTFAPFEVHLYQISGGEAAAIAAAEGSSRKPSKVFSIRRSR